MANQLSGDGKRSGAAQQHSSTTQQAESKARELTQKAEHQATTRAAGQKEHVTNQLDHVARALRKTGNNLREEEQKNVARYADDAAGQVERFSGYLRDRQPEDLLYETEQFARREPALFLGGAFALGLIGARFLKSSNPQRDVQRRRYRPQYADSDVGRTSNPRRSAENPLRGPSEIQKEENYVRR